MTLKLLANAQTAIYSLAATVYDKFYGNSTFMQCSSTACNMLQDIENSIKTNTDKSSLRLICADMEKQQFLY